MSVKGLVLGDLAGPDLCIVGAVSTAVSLASQRHIKPLPKYLKTSFQLYLLLSFHCVGQLANCKSKVAGFCYLTASHRSCQTKSADFRDKWGSLSKAR